MRPRVYAIALVAALSLFGCGNRRDRNFQTEAPPAEQSPASPAPAKQQVVTDSAGAAAPPAAGEPGAPAPVPVERKIIRSGQISVRVGSLDTAERVLGLIAAANGGYTANSSRMRESGNTLSGTIELRFPSDKFEKVMASVRELGDVSSENITSADVTEQYVDLSARLKTQQELEARLLKLLEEHTGKLEDVIAVEGKLADVRNAIEDATGKLRYLENQVSLSTLTVNMVEPGAIGSSETETFGGRMGRAFERGIDGLIDMIGICITTVLALLPVIALCLLLYYTIIRPWRRKKSVKAKEESVKAKV